MVVIALLEETNGTFVGGHKFLTSRSSVVHTNCVHICPSVRSLSSRHFVPQVHICSSKVAPPRITGTARSPLEVCLAL